MFVIALIVGACGAIFSSVAKATDSKPLMFVSAMAYFASAALFIMNAFACFTFYFLIVIFK